MTYTNLTLFLLGMLGILLHNLVKLDKLNKEQSGKLNYANYFKMEWISILISIIVVGTVTWISQEVKELADAGKYLGLGMVTVGYFAQSILITFMGKAEKTINSKIDSGAPSSPPNV